LYSLLLRVLKRDPLMEDYLRYLEPRMSKEPSLRGSSREGSAP
jgi:hypothetical protein